MAKNTSVKENSNAEEQRNVQEQRNAGGQQRNVEERRDRSAAADLALQPPVDVIEDAGGITLFADLPGVSKDKLKLQLEIDSLTIEGDVALDLPQDMESSYAEVKVPRYRRIFTLSKDLDGEKTSAELKNGVLKLRIPKAAHAQPRKIQINVS